MSVWSDRIVVYYGKECHYAVRWRAWGDKEVDASFAIFDTKIEAERLYNAIIEQHRTNRLPDGPVEIFHSQAKWVRYHGADDDEMGVVRYRPIGEWSDMCVSGRHEQCEDALADHYCTCPHHLESLDELVK